MKFLSYPSLSFIYSKFLISKFTEIIIVDYGSSFFFNCIFQKNKKIIVLNNYRWFEFQTNEFIYLKILFDIININNNVHIINPIEDTNILNYNSIKDFL